MFARLFSLLGARKCSSLYVDYLTGNASNQEHEVTIIPGVVGTVCCPLVFDNETGIHMML